MSVLANKVIYVGKSGNGKPSRKIRKLGRKIYLTQRLRITYPIWTKLLKAAFDRSERECNTAEVARSITATFIIIRPRRGSEVSCIGRQVVLRLLNADLHGIKEMDSILEEVETQPMAELDAWKGVRAME